MSVNPSLVLHTGPFMQRGMTTPRVMVDVIISLLPIMVGAAYYFGIVALLLIAASVSGAVFTEYLFNRKRMRLVDGSVILTGLLLGFTLPPSMPLWMAFLGGVTAIGFGRMVFGGLGNNLFNPALVGRAFLQAAFPTAITTWMVQGRPFFEVPPSTFAAPLMHGTDLAPDAVSSATPLAAWKTDLPSTWNLLSGNTSGSIGETFAVLILIGGAYLLYRRAFDWRIPASILLTVAIFTAILHQIDSTAYPTPSFMLLSGGLLFGTIFMATDPVTSPMSPRGTWIFGIGIGVLVVLIRLFGGLPEGVMYAILLMNAATPLIERYIQPRRFGSSRSHS